MKTSELRDLSTDDLNARMRDANEELMNLRFQLATGELTDYTRLRHTRRMIARMATVLRERDLAAEKEGEG
jgi:large subunit ribosomal protein L29